MVEKNPSINDSTVLIVESNKKKKEDHGQSTKKSHKILKVANLSLSNNNSVPNLSAEPDKIDYILVWEEIFPKDTHSIKKIRESLHTDSDPHIWRITFLEQLKATGLHVEQHETNKGTKTIHYVLLSAPWTLLCQYAEFLRMKMPLQVLPDHHINWSSMLIGNLGVKNLLYEEVPNRPQNHYNCQFKITKLCKFLGSDNPKTFFERTKRHQIIYEILKNTTFEHRKRGLSGIEQLLNEKVFAAAFPPHDGPFKIPPEGLDPKEMNERQILYHYWARWNKWMKYQPVDHIRRYFGEKIAFYFTWLGFYTAWLLPASVVGVLCFLVGCFNLNTDVPTQEICDTKDDYWMCPLCSGCSFWKLSSICNIVKIERVFDHGGSIFFSMFMCLWAVTFLEFWKRKSAELAYQWDCYDYKDYEERPRPQFVAMAPIMTRNPITNLEEPDFPPKNSLQRFLTSSSNILGLFLSSVMILLFILCYRTAVLILVSKSTNAFFRKWTTWIAGISSSFLDLFLILFLSRVSIPLAYTLTNWEMHKTQSKFEDAVVLKMFIFQSITLFSLPIYISFFMGRFSGYPGKYNSFLGIKARNCINSNCLVELAQEMLVILVGKQTFNNILEICIPKMQLWQQRKKLHSKETTNMWEANYELLKYSGLLQEYLEMVLQFGFITIFVASCPLAPLFALFNNWLEIRLDAQKFVCQYRRPVAEKAQSLGIWFRLLQTITYSAIFSNAVLIAFMSDFLQRAYYRYSYSYSLHGYVNFTLAQAPKIFTSIHNRTCRYRGFREEDGHHSMTFWKITAIRLAFIITFEHIIFFMAWLIDVLVPNIPESVAINVKHEHYLAKQALADHEVTSGTKLTASTMMESVHRGVSTCFL